MNINDRLQLLKIKAENATQQAIKARDAANLASQYAIDCQTLVIALIDADITIGSSK
jgi:hypothetical protein